MGQSFCQNNSTGNYQNPPLRGILKRLSQFLLPQWLDIRNSFFSFFNVYVFINNKRTIIARDIFFFRKYRYLNSLSNATHPIQIHRTVLEKLPFEKKLKKTLTSNISEIYGSILLPKELNRLGYKIYL